MLNHQNISSQTNQIKNNRVVSYTIDSTETFQTIDNFGASDAWSTQFVGRWPEAKKEKIASLLFSREVDKDGNPKGIGLSLWRFNLGAGSAQQGDKSGIKDEWRRAESFLQMDGSYDWTRQKGQIWFAKQAKQYGVEDFLVFSNSPPIWFTRNKKAYTASGKTANLAEDKFKEYADFLANSIEGLEKMGLKVDYISPINEPQWDWQDGGQEGTPFWNDQIADLVRSLNSAFTKKDLNTKIDIAEAAQINYLWEEDNKPGRGNQIEEFFNQNSKNYIGDLSNISPGISGHSYFTTWPETKLIEERKSLASYLENYEDLKFWMSEYCILGDNTGEIDGSGRDLGIDPALYMAKVIHNDLTIAQASAWHWWLAISPYDYKDGLIYIDKNKENGNFYESKMLWALGNYSRFIKPGSLRLAIESTQKSQDDLLTSAFKKDNTLVLVIINKNDNDKTIDFKLNEEKFIPEYAYITSLTKSLEKIDLQKYEAINIPAKSITTFVSSL